MRRTLPVAAVLALGFATNGDVAASAEPPNILFVIADDWGAHAGAYGTPWIRTPNFDRVAREGVLFTRAYTPVAKCAPSRAIALTGRHAWQNGEAGNHLAYFPVGLTTWTEVLGEHGWHVGITGKGWAPGIARDANGNPRPLVGRSYNRREAEPPTRHISRNDYAGNFADFLDAAPPGAPWCFWAGPSEPHRRLEFRSGVTLGGRQPAAIDRVPAYWPDEETVRIDMLDYAFAAEHVDRHLGRMIAELENRGLLDSTLIIVTGDHGMPFPRVKGYAYHDSNHVPLAVRLPRGAGHRGRVVEDFVDFTDIAPTILDLAGIDPARSGMQAFSGRSWRPIFESARSGRVEPGRDHVLVGKERTDVGRPHDWGYPIRGILTAEALYLVNHEPSRWPAGNPETGYLDTDGSPTKTLILERGRRDRDDRFWRLCFGIRPAEEFFDLRTDRDCVRNLAADPAQRPRMDALRQRMEAALLAQGDPRMLGQGAVFDAYPATKGRGFYERHQRGEPVEADWVEPTDFEPQPLSLP
jgi:arylsulfatase A-like enzyme